MTKRDDDALDAALAQALGPQADDTAPLSRAVLNRIAEQGPTHRVPMVEVLAAPLPLTALMLGALILAAATGFALAPSEADETMLLQILIGVGF